MRDGRPMCRPLLSLQSAAAAALLVLSPAACLAIDCSASATNINFGIYDAVRPAPTDTTGALTVSCTNAGPRDRAVSYTVTLSSGNGTSPSTRWLASGAHRLYYNLYRDAARVEIWGDGTSGSFIASGTLRPGPGVGNATRSRTHTVYGRMPANQDAAAGAYTDAIIYTLTF